MTDNRRTSTRHAVSLAATLTIDGGAVSSRVINLSLGGALVESPQRLTMGKRVHIVFHVPIENHQIDIAATVRWSDSTGVGIQFDGLRARDVWALNEYFKQLV